MRGDCFRDHYRLLRLVSGGQFPNRIRQSYRKRRNELHFRVRRVSIRWEHTRQLELRESMRCLHQFGLPFDLQLWASPPTGQW